MTAHRRVGLCSAIVSIIAAVGMVFTSLAIADGRDAKDARALQGTTHGGRFQGRIVRTFSAPDDDPMLLPSDVAVAPDGHVYVADGTHDRIVCFDATGRVVRVLDGAPSDALSQPLGLCVDRDGRLWVADTGNARIVVFDRNGRIESSLSVGSPSGPDAADLTDVVLTADGRAALGVDNRHHRLLRIDLSTKFVSTFGAFGQALGQFDHPFLIATDAQGRAFVSDVINARVVALADDGASSAVISGFGVDLGRVYRPKGVACDAQGRVWVGDGRLGVVQAFANQGRWIDVLRGDDGQPMKFDAPCGMSFGPEGDLYVVESSRARVVMVSLREDAAAPQTAAPPVVTGRQPQACAVCHIEWVAPLIEGKGTPLMAVPDNPPEYPLVSRPENCLSCHDGSVTDSRRKVWVEHGHRHGVMPPDDMHVPAALPLVDGQIVCRTCHSAHTRGGAGNTMKDAVFLRVSSDPNQLCVTCHAALTTGAVDGMHPLICASDAPGGAADSAASDVAASPATPAPVTECLTCHAPHGSGRDALLKTPDRPDALCLKCHESVTHGGGALTGHPVTGALTAEQSAAVLSAGARPRFAESLGCLACHAVHRAPSPTRLLRAPSEDSRLCLICHADKGAVEGTLHDLRQSAPAYPTPSGAPASETALCMSCHAIHPIAGAADGKGAAVDLVEQAQQRGDAFVLADNNGSCGVCHRSGGCAQSRSAQPFGHPIDVEVDRLARLRDDLERGDAGNPSSECLTCRDCHDPHCADHTSFLRAAPDDLCITCHTEKSAIASGPHDFIGKDAQVNRAGRNAAQSGRCGSCHAIHQTTGPALWVATSDTPANAQDACLSCHRVGGRGRDAVPGNLLHPLSRPTSVLAAQTVLPLFDDHGRRSDDGSVSCATCHDPHAPLSATAMLRGIGDSERTDLCALCHAQAETLAASPHDPHAWAQHAQVDLTCSPCHAVHAPPQWASDAKTWIAPRGTTDARAIDALPGADLCTGCHRAGDIGGHDIRAAHPRIPMTSMATPDGGGALPLLDDMGALGDHGFITCQTCHAPHGTLSADEARSLRGLDATGAVLRSSKPMLRPYVAPNLCTQCHGFEGLSRFLLFHRWTEPSSSIASTP